MDFNATIDLIIKDLDEARKIIDDLKKYPGVPTLQVELAKSKCKSAGEVIALLKEMNISESAPVKPVQIIEEKQIIELSSPVIAEPEEVIPVQQEQETKMPVRPVKSKPAVVETPPAEFVAEDKKVVATKPEPVAEQTKKGDDSTILADSFSHLSNRFNEQLGNLRKDDDVSSQMNTKPISSLTEAIGLNDKFLFMKEIFNGDKEAYSQAISRLENSSSLADARAVIMSYTGHSDENEAVKQLIDLVKRKLPSNE